MRRTGLLLAMMLAATLVSPAWGDYYIWPPVHDEWGVQAYTTIGRNGATWTYDSEGYRGTADASSDASDSRGAGSTHGTIGLTPEFTAYGEMTDTTEGAYCYNHVYGIEAYTYNGPGLPMSSNPLTLEASLTGSVDPAAGDPWNATISAEIYVFNSPYFFFCGDVASEMEGEPSATIKSVWTGGMVTNPPDAIITLHINPEETILDGDTTFAVSPGETVYVFMDLETRCSGANAVADCASTLNLSFTDDTYLTAGSLTTGEDVPVGPDLSGSVNGGAGNHGGTDYSFANVTGAGTLLVGAVAAQPGEDNQWGAVDVPEPPVDLSAILEAWDVQFDGEFETVTLTFWYDETLLPAGFDENNLEIWHFDDMTWDWELLDALVDPVANTITFTTDSLSPFVMTPEPATLALLAIGAVGLIRRRRR